MGPGGRAQCAPPSNTLIFLDYDFFLPSPTVQTQNMFLPLIGKQQKYEISRLVCTPNTRVIEKTQNFKMLASARETE